MAAYAQVTGTDEILFCDRHGRPENRVTTGVGHHAAAPVVSGLDRSVVAAVTVIALVGRLKVADFSRLGTRLLDVRWYDIRSKCRSQCKECHGKQDSGQDTLHADTPEKDIVNSAITVLMTIILWH